MTLFMLCRQPRNCVTVLEVSAQAGFRLKQARKMVHSRAKTYLIVAQEREASLRVKRHTNKVRLNTGIPVHT